MAQIPTRKFETSVAVFAIVAVLALGAVLSRGIIEAAAAILDNKKFETLQSDVGSLQSKADSIDAEVAEMTSKLPDYEQQLDPGPEPSRWFSPLEHWSWSKKKDAFDLAKRIYAALDERKSIAQSLAMKKPILDTSKGIVDKEHNLLRWSSQLWNGWIAPILHFLLVITLILLVPKIILRLILINGWTETYRV